MTRYPDWAARLDAFLRENAKRKFRYGKWDCGLFSAGAIQAMTGTDPAADFRGSYVSAQEVKSVIWKFCHSHSVAVLASAVAARFDMPEVKPAYARRGDLVLIQRPRDFSLGIVSLDGRSVTVVGSKGLVCVPLGLGKRGWKI
jgi:hypothetical protein